MIRPLSSCHTLSFMGKKSNGPRVVPLLLVGGPAAIRGPSPFGAFLAMSAGIVAVVVFAVYGHSIRGVAHIGKEAGEFHPSFADSDSSTAVEAEMRGLGVETSRLHVQPRIVQRPPGLTVSSSNPRGRLPLEASAGLGVSCFQRMGADSEFSSAFELTEPIPSSPHAFYGGNDGEPNEFLTSEVNEAPMVANWRGRGNDLRGIAHEIDGLMFSGRGLLSADCARAIIG